MNECPFCKQKFHPNMVRHYCTAMITDLVIALANIRNEFNRWIDPGKDIMLHEIDLVLNKARTVKGYEHL